MKKIIVTVFFCTVIGFFAYKLISGKDQIKESVNPISVQPITQQWVERENEKVLKVTFGETVLEIPKIYNPSGLDKYTKSIYFYVFGKELIPHLSENLKGYSVRVLITPKNPLSNFDQSENIAWLLRNDYILRESVDYPSLLEYWNEEKQMSYYFLAKNKLKVINEVIGCTPGFRKNLEVKEKSVIKMGDASCTIYGVISGSAVIKIRFDARLLLEGKEFHQSIDQLISSFIVKR